MIEELNRIARYIGNTPLIQLRNENATLHAKLEYNNFSGSSKDRAGFSILYNAFKQGKINAETVVIASSSGNLAIALATICGMIGIRFIPVIDPNINKNYESLLSMISYRVVKVEDRDETGGFLLTRVNTVNRMCAELRNSFCADQYGDPNNYRGYYGLGKEILDAFTELDYIFVPISSSGAITGISKSVKRSRPGTKIIAVDVKGSVIFGDTPEKRHISGIGSSMVPPILKNAIIDDVVHVSQREIVRGCRELLQEQLLFTGASSGAVYFAAKRYLGKTTNGKKKTGLLIFPDRGNAYLDTVYNQEWAEANLPGKEEVCMVDSNIF